MTHLPLPLSPFNVYIIGVNCTTLTINRGIVDSDNSTVSNWHGSYGDNVTVRCALGYVFSSSPNVPTARVQLRCGIGGVDNSMWYPTNVMCVRE